MGCLGILFALNAARAQGAARYRRRPILPQAEWVFITASSIANKTRAQLTPERPRSVVLMGPECALAV